MSYGRFRKEGEHDWLYVDVKMGSREHAMQVIDETRRQLRDRYNLYRGAYDAGRRYERGGR